MTKKIITAGMLAMVLSACSNGGGNKKSDGSQKTAASQKKVDSSSVKTSHILQMTVINFLSGGSEPCNLKDKIFSFSSGDKDVVIPLCKNSRVEVNAVSNSGVVTFHAIDILRQKELAQKYYDKNSVDQQHFELGKTKGMLRYGVVNPFGFTYVMAEEVTGIDMSLLEKWNELNNRATKLREQILLSEQQGSRPLEEVVKELGEIDNQLLELRAKMGGSK